MHRGHEIVAHVRREHIGISTAAGKPCSLVELKQKLCIYANIEAQI